MAREALRECCLRALVQCVSESVKKSSILGCVVNSISH